MNLNYGHVVILNRALKLILKGHAHDYVCAQDTVQ